MCNLYRLRVSRWELLDYYGAHDAWREEMAKDYVSAGRLGPVIAGGDSGRELRGMRWGFPPPPGVRSAVVNVRNYASPFWRSALANPERRCLVPVTSFQEGRSSPTRTPVRSGPTGSPYRRGRSSPSRACGARPTPGRRSRS